jgi:hypothetical protein
VGDFDNIKSRTVTPEYAEGHSRTFGTSTEEIKQPKRTRYVYRNGVAVEVGTDWVEPEAEAPAKLNVVTDLYMDGVRTADTGEDIGSRAKRREYMKREGLSDMSDWKDTWAAAAKKREAVLNGTLDRAARREAIGRALYEANKQRSK